MTEDEFAECLEQAVQALPAQWRDALADEILCIIEPEIVKTKPNGKITVAHYVPALRTITVFQKACELCYKPERMMKELRQTLEHELGHAGGLSHSQMA